MNVRSELERYGVNRENIRDLSAPSPDILDYLDLAHVDGGEELRPDGVIESSHRPILYYLNATRLAVAPAFDDERLKDLSRNVACRGERAYLAIVKPGLLEVAPVSLLDKQPSWRTFQADSTEAINFFTNLVHANVPDDDLGDSNLVFDEMLNLLETGADRIRRRIGKANTLSLIGRALFFRFLCDRGIVTENDVPKICQTADGIKACFDNAENSFRTSRWLDETFNGDFLPFDARPTRQFFKGLNRSTVVYHNLSAIIRGDSPVGSEGYQCQFDWATFDFAHVPVGLLSQVYEAFSWKWEEEESGATSVHYTPRNIAKTIVDEVFDGLENAHKARILDPACGAGVFLVLAFRRLYREHWQASGKRPDTKLIRKILEKQICGFDISDSALRLAALSLYLTAIELDAKPVPPEKLRFNYLDDLTLFNHRKEDDPESGPVIGSLGQHVSDGFDGSFDLVISNPPWTQIEKKKHPTLVKQLDEVSKKVVLARSEEVGKSYRNPGSTPDLPFLWKATEWCKAGGRIAMALPSRTLFQNTGPSKYARESILKLVRVSGIVNCSSVRKTNVWPNMDQPFMLFFAVNDCPTGSGKFSFICPQANTRSNSVGELHIDPDSSQDLSFDEAIESPWLLKCLTVGSTLDVSLIRKIKTRAAFSLSSFWSEQGLVSSRGYEVKGDRNDSTKIIGFPDISEPLSGHPEFVLKPHRYKQFDRNVLHRTRFKKPQEHPDALAVYRAPLVAIKKSVSSARTSVVATRSEKADSVYRETYYGYSANGYDNAIMLVKYLQLFAHSRFWRYYTLCTSAKLGVERPYFYKEDLDSCPFVDLAELTAQQLDQIENLARQLVESVSEDVFTEIDRLFASIYGLDDRDIQVLADTLEVRNPNDESGERGSAHVEEVEAALFVADIKRFLAPFARRVNVKLKVTLHRSIDSSTFRFLHITDADAPPRSGGEIAESTLELATKTGTSRIIQRGDHQLLIGILNQYRYWTPSRARLLAADILREYFATFEDAR